MAAIATVLPWHDVICTISIQYTRHFQEQTFGFEQRTIRKNIAQEYEETLADSENDNEEIGSER